MNEQLGQYEKSLLGESRRIDLAHIAQFDLGPVEVQPSLRTIAGPDGETMLEPKVMQVLVALCDPAGEILSRDDLIDRCWEGRVVGDTSINRVISLLRGALREVAGDAVTVDNVPKVGYRLLVHSPETAIPKQGEEGPGGAPEAAPGLLRSPATITAALGAAVALILAAFWLQEGFGTSSEPVSVVILPLETDEGVDPIYAKGLESELRSEMGRNEGVIVSTPESALQLIDQGFDTVEIGRKLNSDFVITGRVTNSVERVALVLEATNVKENARPWASTIGAAPDQAQNLPQRASREFLAGIGQPSSGRLRSSEVSQGSFAAYLSAIGLIKSRDPAQMRQAQMLLEQVVEDSPRFSQGWSGLAKALYLSNLYQPGEGDRSIEMAREYAQRAMQLDPESVEALKISGLMEEDSEARHRLLKRAVELDPGDAEAWFWLSHAAAHPDFAGGELEAIAKAARLDPLWNRTWQAPGYAASAGRFDLADELDRNVIAAAAHQWQKDLAEARIKLRQGDLSEYLRLTAAAMEAMDPAAREVASVPLANIRVLLGIVPERLREPGGGLMMEQISYGILPPKRVFDENGVKAENFFGILPIAIAAPSLFIRDGRTDELLAYYDEAFGSPEAAREFAEGQMRPHHLMPNMGIYLGVALREAGRGEEAEAMFALAEESVARWNESGVPDMTAVIFEANLAAARGQDERAIEATRTLVEGLGWPYAMQSPGVALQGPLGDDPIWADLKGDPRLEAVLAPVKTNLAKERRELSAAGY